MSALQSDRAQLCHSASCHSNIQGGSRVTTNCDTTATIAVQPHCAHSGHIGTVHGKKKMHICFTVQPKLNDIPPLSLCATSPPVQPGQGDGGSPPTKQTVPVQE